MSQKQKATDNSYETEEFGIEQGGGGGLLHRLQINRYKTINRF